MREELPDFSRLPEDSAKDLHRFGVGLFLMLVVLLVLVLIYAVGEKLDGFRWHTFRNGLFSFGVIILSVCAAVVGVTAAIRGVTFLWPEATQRLYERRQLGKAARAAADAIAKKHRLNEERARLTAQLQATWLFEKETTNTANAQAAEQFREALQGSVMRSCRMAFDQISQVIEQYERTVSEISASELPDSEKTELLNSLMQQLDVAATEDRNRDARKMMEAEIWKVRFRKARLLARDKKSAALVYLQQIQQEAGSARLRSKIAALIAALDSDEAG